MSTPLELLTAQRPNMDACIRCGLCLSVCPTYQTTIMEEESPRGRIAMARAVAAGVVPLDAEIVRHQESCLLCEACTAICPAGFRMEEMGIAVRRAVRESGKVGRMRRMALRFAFRGPLAHMWLLRLLSRGLWLYQRSGSQWLARRSGLLRLLRLARVERLTPRMPARFFVAKGQSWPPSTPAADDAPRVGLFAGCVMSTAFAETDEATARVLAANGCEVVAPAGQGCCGALQAHSGAWHEARERARRVIDSFQQPFDAIVVNAAGCGSAMKGYGHLLADDPDYAEKAARFSERVRDVAEFLVSRPLNGNLGPLDATVTYQEPCHLAYAQRIRNAPRELLTAIPGLTLAEMKESALCCGSAGIYNVTQGAMAESLLDRKLENALATNASIIVTGNPGCHIQLAAGIHDRGSNVRIAHVVDLLDEAYRRAEDSSSHAEPTID
ncbi:MAG TPA: (Fe-S)-binding protein [Dehalococcoidia bacterium]|nr:(Fe-S)-binding protein [Dehalococcoidia bacterium]